MTPPFQMKAQFSSLMYEPYKHKNISLHFLILAEAASQAETRVQTLKTNYMENEERPNECHDNVTFFQNALNQRIHMYIICPF